MDYRNSLSVVIYLNTRSQCRSKKGTVFWEKISKDEWMEKSFVPMEPNRCVIFDSQIPHSIDSNFGHRISDARLTQIFFLFRGHNKNGINCC